MSGFSVSDLGFAQFAEHIERQGAVDRLRASGEAGGPGGGITRAQIDEIAQTFEQMLMNVLVEEMREAMPESDLLPKAPGLDLYEQMMYQEFVRSAGDRGIDLGMRQAIERHFEAFLIDTEREPAEMPALPAPPAGPSPEGSSPGGVDSGEHSDGKEDGRELNHPAR